MQTPHLIADDLACRRGYRLLFRAVSFGLSAGDALHITGANGIGKSSLIRVLAGLMRPFAGSVSIAGAAGLLDERPALDPFLPLGQALAFWAGLDAADTSETINAADLGIADLMDVPVRFLSTGQKKRAALARLTAQAAPIWLLDEPLNGLDTGAVRIAERMIAQHRERGGIAVVASHQTIALDRAQTIELERFSG